ncbi:N-6 DNA methylase [Saccharopolyspora shandongensis]|uniref:N-6 DNA methylase n=1 Tax=Saccharopolyspora shandongensis TaxID=418495 RepID=UPI0033C436D7
MTNKPLNFVQRIAIQLDIPGRAAVVVQDNVLFEGGAGEAVCGRPGDRLPSHPAEICP